MRDVTNCTHCSRRGHTAAAAAVRPTQVKLSRAGPGPSGCMTLTRVSNLEKSREILTSLAPSRSKKLNFHSLSLLHFQDFEEKILFLFSIYENLKHKSRSLLDLDLEFSSGSVCVWN